MVLWNGEVDFTYVSAIIPVSNFYYTVFDIFVHI